MDKKIKQIAEEAMPGWKAINQLPVDSDVKVESDATGVDIDMLKRKYLPSDSLSSGRDAPSVPTATKAPSGHTEFVVMAPKKATDSLVGNKVILVKKDKPVGSQG